MFYWGRERKTIFFSFSELKNAVLKLYQFKRNSPSFDKLNEMAELERCKFETARFHFLVTFSLQLPSWFLKMGAYLLQAHLRGGGGGKGLNRDGGAI